MIKIDSIKKSILFVSFTMILVLQFIVPTYVYAEATAFDLNTAIPTQSTNPNISAEDVVKKAQDPRSTGFKFLICDGPEALKHFNPAKNTIDPSYTDLNFIPCNFQGIVLQIRHFINLMIIVGTMAVIVGFLYAGLLYISGEEKKIETAKKMLPTMIKGFVIMLGAWFIIYQILSWIASDSGIGASVKKILGG